MAIPGFRRGHFAHWLSGLPKVGHTLQSLIEAAGLYRRRPKVLAAAMLISIGVHVLFVTSIYLLARGLPVEHPTYLEHFVIVPLSMVTGTLPLPAGGLGAFEFVMKTFYEKLMGTAAAGSQGLMVALGYRAITIAVAVVGLVYYLVSRKDVSRTIHDAQDEMETGDAAIV